MNVQNIKLCYIVRSLVHLSPGPSAQTGSSSPGPQAEGLPGLLPDILLIGDARDYTCDNLHPKPSSELASELQLLPRQRKVMVC